MILYATSLSIEGALFCLLSDILADCLSGFFLDHWTPRNLDASATWGVFAFLTSYMYHRRSFRGGSGVGDCFDFLF